MFDLSLHFFQIFKTIFGWISPVSSIAVRLFLRNTRGIKIREIQIREIKYRDYGKQQT